MPTAKSKTATARNQQISRRLGFVLEEAKARKRQQETALIEEAYTSAPSIDERNCVIRRVAGQAGPIRAAA